MPGDAKFKTKAFEDRCKPTVEALEKQYAILEAIDKYEKETVCGWPAEPGIPTDKQAIGHPTILPVRWEDIGRDFHNRWREYREAVQLARSNFRSKISSIKGRAAWARLPESTVDEAQREDPAQLAYVDDKSIEDDYNNWIGDTPYPEGAPVDTSLKSSAKMLLDRMFLTRTRVRL